MVLLFSGTVFKVASGGGPSIELSEVPKPVISTLRKAFSSCHYNLFFFLGFHPLSTAPREVQFCSYKHICKVKLYLQQVLEKTAKTAVFLVAKKRF